ncbi:MULTISPECIES: GlsB/YeaQ/YmgE family stress response membrane protein [Kineococcus]|uniref:GlsB/YeaQ/YmgE family stress response membrane protein n=1 Tax=unclassified Kineococcus TaxID=2621656 RepID=UPI001F5AD2BF|nr:GlsB/YeaQ/YmgE family stress response membrane protein [Kineococcus sp. TRM81007]MCI2239604.1 GlsB/YeaQ/YmgE family stress response membrane protein [Kineococcus sp. TRM81007]MCI3926114.1 GlsB/YeaQ/YmgE family stress response membrane protein [Paenibacillus sp. TRM 82003]
MGISFLSAIIVGLIIGALARLVLPGKQKIGIIATILVGIVAALIGLAISAAIGLTDDGFSIITLIIQVVLAAIGVSILAGSSRRSVRR